MKRWLAPPHENRRQLRGKPSLAPRAVKPRSGAALRVEDDPPFWSKVNDEGVIEAECRRGGTCQGGRRSRQDALPTGSGLGEPQAQCARADASTRVGERTQCRLLVSLTSGLGLARLGPGARFVALNAATHTDPSGVPCGSHMACAGRHRRVGRGSRGVCPARSSVALPGSTAGSRFGRTHATASRAGRDRAVRPEERADRGMCGVGQAARR